MATSKTNTGELLNRYIWLVDTIYSAGHISFEDINRKWQQSHLNDDGSELPIRTFHAHRKAVEDLFDIIISCDKKNGFKYYIENAEDIEKDLLRKWLVSSMSVRNALAESESLRQRILLEDIPSGMNYLTQIMDAMREGLAIEFAHKGFWKEKEYYVRLEPYCLKLFQQRWYVLGHHEDFDRMRVYALDRIYNVTTTKIKFKMPKDFDGSAFFADYFGVYADTDMKLQMVRLKAYGAQRHYLRSLPIHHSQKEVETGENYCVFEYLIRPTKDFIKELISMADCTEVLSPEWVAEEVRQHVKVMYDNVNR